MSRTNPPKTEESKLNRFKHFLGIGQKSGNTPATHSQRPIQEHICTPEILKEIGPTSPANNRLRTIRELCEVVQLKRLEENAIEALWKSVSDLLAPNIATEDRHLALRFLTALIKGQYDELGILRAHFFRVIKENTLFEDLPLKLEMFKVLSNEGKDLTYFEEDTGAFLLEWMKDVISSSKIAEFLSLLVNVIKYNAAYLDEDIVAALILHTTLIANRTGREEDIGLCLKVLDTVVAYSCLPPESLYQFTACMCRVVYIERFSQSCWMLMRKLLGTHLGHRGIYTMCCILQDKNHITDSGAILLHGAVFFIGMALWGSKRVPSLKHPPSSVLPSFLQALEHSQSSRVAYEVVLSVQRLVTKYGEEQQMVTWDLILDIIEALLRHIETTPDVKPLLISKTHELLTSTEELYEHGQFNGSPARLFCIIETCAAKRPEASILSLVQYKAQSVHPAHEGWIQMLNQIVDKYFRLETRPMIRWKVLDVLAKVISDNQQLYEDELIESVVLPHLSHMEQDPDSNVRQRAAQLFVDLSSTCHTVRGLDLLDLLHRLIVCPVTTPPPSSTSPALDELLEQAGAEREIEDINTAVLGLITIFKVKLYQLPSSHPQRIYEILVKYIQQQYSCERLTRSSGAIRKAIFELLLSLRADGLYRLGLVTVGKEKRTTYSDHIICAYRPEMCDRLPVQQDLTSSPPPMVRSSPSVAQQQRVTVIPYSQAFSVIKDCLEVEKDWTVLEVVLEQLPFLLQNKTLILAASTEDIDRFCARLCAMVSDLSLGLPEKLLTTPHKFSKSDFHSYIFPVLTCLVSYHVHLDRTRQFGLVKCLEFGLVSRCAKDCIRALSVGALEMNDMMMRQLPSILLKLSQISANMAMAIPLMEFLSSLIRLPQLYMNFVEEQYMSVFAIALPYTNPFKYTHYTVSLAYHVIAMWFLKCKFPFRKRFVSFIVKGLRANVLRQFEDSANQRARANKDSSDRNRAQSLNDEALRKKSAAARAAAATKAQGSAPAAVDESMMQFHKELMETCLDMMARYTFSTYGTMPKRTPFAEFLLEGGLSQCWLLGNKIITISTSGGSGVTKSGLCEKCLHIARFAARENAEAARSSSSQSLAARRRRHKSAAVRSLSETVAVKPLSMDDLHLHKQSPREGQSETYLKRQASEDVPQDKNDETQPINSAEDKLQMVDNVLMSLKPNPTDKSIFTKQQCNCWCTLWAEIHIRRPTGNVSWMMRIQNEPDLLAHFPDFPLADLSNLFLNPPDNYDYITRKKIDSMTLGETEYDSLLEEHFESDSYSDNPRPAQSSDEEEKSITSSSLPNLDSTALRKSTSSPELSPPNQDEFTSSEMKTDAAMEMLSHQPELRSRSSEAVDTAVTFPSAIKVGKEHGISQPIDIPGQTVTTKDGPPDMSDAAPRRSRSSTTVSDKPRRVSIAEPPHRTGIESSTLPVMNQAGDGSATHGGMTPSFIFLQLLHANLLDCGEERPLMFPRENQVVDRAVKMLDLVYPYETHKIGVLYVGPGQECDQQAILSNEYGSSRYAEFLKGLGDLVRLVDCNPESLYVGGLDLHGSDGQFAYALHDDFMQVIYHVATLMPNKDSDPNRNAKKLHIGNDYVTLVYNESGAEYKIGTIKGQFNYVNIIVHPLDHGSNAVVVQTRDDIVDIIGHTDTKIISDNHLSKLVRQMAVHADLASTILQRQKSNPKDPFASNWLERLRKIRTTRSKVICEINKERGSGSPGTTTEDFTDFV